MNFKTLLSRWKSRDAEAEVAFPPAKPDTSFCVIGDVHGRVDLLEKAVNAVPDFSTFICVGDLIDRGDHSAETLRFVMQHDHVTSLMGNHEQMMLKFLKSPEKHGRRWLRNGGLQTLASFGIDGVTETSTGDALIQARSRLYEAMGEDMLSWLAQLDCIAWSGNVAVVHAGADPTLALEKHDPDTFIWGHPEFLTHPRQDGMWIVHGHTIVDQPKMVNGRISLDTGAYATGQLTLATFSPEGVEFIST